MAHTKQTSRKATGGMTMQPLPVTNSSVSFKSTMAIDAILSLLNIELSKEEEFCIPNQKKVESLKTILKSIYDASSSSTKRSFGPLTSLIVEGLDEESIWEELQTRTKPLARFVEKKTKVLSRKYDQKLQKQHRATQKKSRSKSEYSDDQSEESDSDDFSAEEERDKEQLDEEGEDEDVFDDEEDEEEGEEDDASKNDREDIPGDFKDDVEMEAWLDAFEEMEYAHKEKMEKKEKRAKASTVESREWEDEKEEEDDLEFVENALYEDSDDDEDFDPKALKFSDFFVDDKRSNSHKRSASSHKSKSMDDEEEDDDMDMDMEDDDEEEEDEERDVDEDDEDNDFEGEDDYVDSEEEGDKKEGERTFGKKSKSSDNKSQQQSKPGQFSTSYERRTKELAEQIAELEKELVADKSWELKGEVKGVIRPENSLLDVAADIERSTKVAPVITQEYTTSLEDRIIERIKASRFDDPTPRTAYNPIIDGDENNGDGELSQEKSKVGLGELYAEEFAKQQLSSTQDVLTVQTQALHEEAINLFNEVSRQLDALTHFFFTPKPVASEASAKVLATQRSIPALEMEDITPYSQNSTALAVAPEQLLEKKRGKKVTLLTSEELTSEDRKKLRRHNKAVRKAKKVAEQGDVRNIRREADKKLNEELKADKRVVFAGGDSKDNKSHKDSNQFGKSSVFFSKLQEEAKQQVGGKAQGNNNKRKRDSTSEGADAVRFKL